MASLRKLHGSLLEGFSVTEGGIDVTTHEAASLGLQTVALGAAPIEVMHGKR